MPNEGVDLAHGRDRRANCRVGLPDVLRSGGETDLDDDEIDCPGCDELVDVRRPLAVEVTILDEPSMTSVPNPVTILVGGMVVHRCDPHDVAAEGRGQAGRRAAPGAPERLLRARPIVGCAQVRAGEDPKRYSSARAIATPRPINSITSQSVPRPSRPVDRSSPR